MHPKDARRGDTEEFIRVRFVYEYNTFTTCIQTNGCLPFHQEDGLWRDRPPAKRHKGKEGYVVNDVGEAKKKEKKKMMITMTMTTMKVRDMVMLDLKKLMKTLVM